MPCVLQYFFIKQKVSFTFKNRKKAVSDLYVVEFSSVSVDFLSVDWY